MKSIDKELIRYWVGCINAEDDWSLREAAGIELIKEIYYTLGDYGRLDYNGITISETYINYDSDCGLSVIEASIDLDIIADYLLENEDVNTITLADAARIMHEEFGERNEYWNDLIDEDGFAQDADEIINILEYILEERESYDEKLRQDLKNYKREN